MCSGSLLGATAWPFSQGRDERGGKGKGGRRDLDGGGSRALMMDRAPRPRLRRAEEALGVFGSGTRSPSSALLNPFWLGGFPY